MKRKQRNEYIIYGKPLIPNLGIQTWYSKELQKLVIAMCKTCTKQIGGLFKENEDSVSYAKDESLSSQERILLNKLNREFEQVFIKKANELADSMVARENKYATASVKSSVNGVIEGFSVKGPLVSPHTAEIGKAAIFENVSLIKSIQSEYFTQITGAVSRAILEGQGFGTLVEALSKYEGITLRRARNIAADQTRKTYEALTDAKMVKAGLNWYKWVHSNNLKNPREWHKKDVSQGGLNNGIFSIDDTKPAIDPKLKIKVRPGQLPFCQCFKVPILFFGGLKELERYLKNGKEDRP